MAENNLVKNANTKSNINNMISLHVWVKINIYHNKWKFFKNCDVQCSISVPVVQRVGFSHESVSALFSLNIYTYVQNLDNTIKLNALKLLESLPAHLWYMNNVLTQENFYATNIFTIKFTTQYTTQQQCIGLMCYTILWNKKKTW